MVFFFFFIFLDVPSYFAERRHKGHFVSLPVVALSYALAFVMHLKILSRMNVAIAIHKVSGKELYKKQKTIMLATRGP